MTFTEYCLHASDTARYPRDRGLEYVVAGLVGEAGELAGEYSKSIRDDSGEVTPERRERLLAELGDVLWFAARVAFELGTTLDEVACKNLEKLAGRARRGTIGGAGDR